ncbi:hypothetical protein ES703_88548 [subsurface metagenome]
MVVGPIVDIGFGRSMVIRGVAPKGSLKVAVMVSVPTSTWLGLVSLYVMVPVGLRLSTRKFCEVRGRRLFLVPSFMVKRTRTSFWSIPLSPVTS